MTRFSARQRAQAYSLVVGLAVGVLVAGVVIPTVVPEPATTVASGRLEAGESGDGTDDGGTGAVGEDGAAGDAVASADGLGTVSGAVGGATTGARTARGNVVGGTGSGSGTSGGGGGGAVPQKGASVKVGVMLLDLANASALGFPTLASIEDQRKVWQRRFDQQNAAGGVNGHPLEPVFTTYDPVSQSSMREACLYLTENKKVFLATGSGGFIGPAMLCFTEEHGTPLLLQGSTVPQEYFTRSKGLLFTAYMGSDRATTNLAHELDTSGFVRDKKVGILFDLRGGPASIARRMESELKNRGIDVAHVSVFSEDFSTAAGQVPIEVQQHSTKGVQVIVNLSHALVFTQFVQDASSRGYRVPYFSSDWNGAHSDFYYSNMPASFDGNMAFTLARTNEARVGLPEPELDRQCREEAGKALGRTLERGSESDFTRDCAFFTLVVKGLVAAGPSPTPASFAQATVNLGRVTLASFGPMAFVPGRPDGGDHYRTIKWDAGCKCLLPISGFRPVRS